MLYDLERVILDYGSVDSTLRFELFLTYYNPDDTSGIGGNIQHLTDGDDLEIHGSLQVPGNVPVQYHHNLMASSHDTGSLRLNFIRENGYRAVISQVWLVERADTGDTQAPSSAITFPAASAQLTGALVEVTGTSTDGAGSGVLSVEVGVDDGSGISWYPVTQLRGDGGWTYRWSLPEDGPYTLYARARDRAGNLETPGPGIGVVVNQRPPAAATGISAFDSSEDSGGSIEVSWQLSADDGGGSDDVTGYELERRADSSADFSVVGAVSSGVGSFTDSSTVDGTQYFYRVITIDLAGNRTSSLEYGPVISINNTLPDSTAPEEVTDLGGIPGNGFIYVSWTRSADTAQDLVDQLLDISVDGGSSWGVTAPTYTDGGFLSLGKEASFHLVEGLTNGTSYLFRIRVKDSSGNISAGTVTAELTPSATVVTEVSGAISADTTWAAGVFYVSNHLWVNAGVTLTIEPGVIVKFAQNRYLSVSGTLNAVGTGGSPIVFTAYTDDSYGGDSNGDGASAGTPGYWDRIQFSNTSSSRLEHVVVRYGGSGNSGSIHMNQSDVPVISSEITEGSSFGIYAYYSSPLIEGNTIANHGSYGIYHYQGTSAVDRDNTITGNDYGIYVRYATPTIDGNTITNNAAYGIYYYDARNAPPITNNTITGNQVPVRLPFSSLPDSSAGNILAPNSRDQIEFWGNTLSRTLTLSADPVSVYYQVGGTAAVAAGAKLTLEPGVVWKFAANTGFDVHGALYAAGTASEKIVFTSYQDDTFGGDTNGDGFGTGQPGDWQRIYFSDSVLGFLTRLEHCLVRFGGSGSTGALYVSRSDISVISTEITESSSYGIYIYDSSPLIKGNTISANGDDGIYVYQATPLIEDNTITDNEDWGIYFTHAQPAPVITGNTVTGNLQGVMLPASALPGSGDGNTLAPNSVNGIWILGSTRESDLALEVLYVGEVHEINTYQIHSTLTMASGASLTVAPGVVVKFASGGGLDIHGALSAVGTSALPVVFTSYRDDHYGGDLNLDGYQSSPVNGDWQGIYFSNQADDASCVLDHVVVRYGGSGYKAYGYAGVTSNQTDFTIQNTVVSNSYGHGIRSYYASLTLSNNEVFGNSSHGIRLEGTGTHTISGSRIFANFGDRGQLHSHGQLVGCGRRAEW
jgi:parallel beta-helix repeat protein